MSSNFSIRQWGLVICVFKTLLMFLALPDWFFGMPPVAEHLWIL
jgi:hypothetical protein